MTDHSTLVAKLKQVDIPNSSTNWIIDFLSDRSQRVKLGNDCFPQFLEVFVDGNQIAQTTSAKLVGVTINSSLTWNDHVDELVKKISRKLYFSVQLKCAQIIPKDFAVSYC